VSSASTLISTAVSTRGELRKRLLHFTDLRMQLRRIFNRAGYIISRLRERDNASRRSTTPWSRVDHPTDHRLTRGSPIDLTKDARRATKEGGRWGRGCDHIQKRKSLNRDKNCFIEGGQRYYRSIDRKFIEAATIKVSTRVIAAWKFRLIADR